MSPWMRVLEQYLVQTLLRTPAFHRGVEKVARTVHRLRHGVPPDEMGGTKIDQPEQQPSFMRNFQEEIREQIGMAQKQQAAKDAQVQATSTPAEENSDAAWRNAQHNASQPTRQGFLGEYMDALKEQMKNEKNPR